MGHFHCCLNARQDATVDLYRLRGYLDDLTSRYSGQVFRVEDMVVGYFKGLVISDFMETCDKGDRSRQKTGRE